MDIYEGNIPIIILCPHDGHVKPQEPGSLIERTKENTTCAKNKFDTELDHHTRDITIGLIEKIYEITKKKSYSVISNIDRAFLDLNREEICAYAKNSTKGNIYYNEYHDTIKNFIKKVNTFPTINGKGFLFDIHGTIHSPADVYRGTNNGDTIRNLINFDPNAMWDNDYGFTRLLIDKGYRVRPSSIQFKEYSLLNGGYTVETYGSNNEGLEHLEAIQLEITHNIRFNIDDRKDPPTIRDDFINDLADCICKFVSHYYPSLNG
jgi:N-formylglutamate amidohydrolase